jgi:hypothetical protein
MKLLLWIFILSVIMVYLSQREGFTSKGIQINQDFNIPETVTKIKSADVKHMIIIPYFIGMNTLNVFINKVNKIDTSFDNVYIFVVDNKEIASEFFSKICFDILDLTSSVIILNKNMNPQINSLYVESTDTVFLYKVNKLLQELYKG